jgi:hypothetical protein
VTTKYVFFYFDLGIAATWQHPAPSPLGACLMQAALLFVGVLTLINFVHI